MKIFEFGAAGLPVVASTSAELRRRALPFVHLADSAEALALLCGQVARQGRGPLGELARRSAAEHAWPDKARRLFEFAASLEPRPCPACPTPEG